MAKKTKKLVRTGIAMAATAIAEVALQRAAEDPRVRRKAKEIAVSAGRGLKRTVKKITGKRRRKTKSTARAAARRQKSGRARSSR